MSEPEVWPLVLPRNAETWFLTEWPETWFLTEWPDLKREDDGGYPFFGYKVYFSDCISPEALSEPPYIR